MNPCLSNHIPHLLSILSTLVAKSSSQPLHLTDMRSAPFNPNFYYNRRLHPRIRRGGIGGLAKVALVGSFVWVISKKVVMR